MKTILTTTSYVCTEIPLGFWLTIAALAVLSYYWVMAKRDLRGDL